LGENQKAGSAWSKFLFPAWGGRGPQPQGPAASGEAKPPSQLFDTLKHREQDPVRGRPEVPRGGQAQAACPVSTVRQQSHLRGCGANARKSAVTTVEAQTRKGSAPRRNNPKRARDAARGEIRRRYTPTGRGIKPLKRSRCGSDAHAPKALARQRPRGMCLRAHPMSRSLGRPILGRCKSQKLSRHCVCYGGRKAKSQEGKRCREASAISARSSSEGSPRERAWLKGHQGVRRGSNASRHMVSARTQRDPGRQSPGVVDLVGWVALGAANLGRVRASAFAAPRSSGNTLKRGPSLRKVTTVRQEPGAPGPKTARWDSNHEAGVAKPMRD
jgi:hypothetical protein